MYDYNVPGGKLNRGMAVYDVLAAVKGAEVRVGMRRCSAGAASQGAGQPARSHNEQQPAPAAVWAV
jgi:ATP-dependent protease ClpP protease subunit